MSKTLIVNTLSCVNNSEQAIVVTNRKSDQSQAVLETFEKVDGVWIRAYKPMHAVIGSKGFTLNKVEGDKKTPAGIFPLSLCFGKYKNPNTLLYYRQTTSNDVWVDDCKSRYYNTWQTGPSNGKWDSAEILRPLFGVHYDYSVVINYNTINRIPCRGSAIFLSIWKGIDIPTNGDVSIAYCNMLKVIRWLDPSKNPIIIQGPINEVVRW